MIILLAMLLAAPRPMHLDPQCPKPRMFFPVCRAFA